MFGYNTVEALEEHFWKVYTRDAYVTNQALKEHDIDTSTYHKYLHYQQLVRRYTGSGAVYLSKNNNFMLRFRSMVEIDRDFQVILMFRDPVSHAGSLLNQHRRYQRLQEDDEFVREYMGWLGHYEFGLDHKRLLFQSSEASVSYNTDTIEYWVSLWADYYRCVLPMTENNQITLVDYQDFLLNPESTLMVLQKKFDLHFDIPKLDQFTNPQKAIEVDKTLLKAAQEIYQELLNKKLSISR